MSISLLPAHARLHCLLAWASVFIAGTLFAKEFNPHTDPENKGNWVFIEDISDGFNGTAVDTDKWFIQGEGGNYQNNFVGRAPSQFVPHALSVADGHFKITTRWEPDYIFSDKINHGRKYENITTVRFRKRSAKTRV
jgi:hypothetical protein|tara:strand:+ start:3920 stop:4330 length:411 start_codon:yes stop_codon:yes gene_type:complete